MEEYSLGKRRCWKGPAMENWEWRVSATVSKQMASKTCSLQADIPPSLHLETTVSKLINDEHEWKEQHFLRDDAEQITKRWLLG